MTFVEDNSAYNTLPSLLKYEVYSYYKPIRALKKVTVFEKLLNALKKS